MATASLAGAEEGNGSTEMPSEGNQEKQWRILPPKDPFNYSSATLGRKTIFGSVQTHLRLSPLFISLCVQDSPDVFENQIKPHLNV